MGHPAAEGRRLGVGAFFMQGLGAGVPGPQVVNAVLVGTVQFRELLSDDVHWQVGVLQGQRHQLLRLWLTALSFIYSMHFRTTPISSCMLIFLLQLSLHCNNNGSLK